MPSPTTATTPAVLAALLPVLAKEVAMGYHDLRYLASEYTLPLETLEGLVNSPKFKHLVERERRALTETGDKLRLTARQLLEAVLPDIAQITTDEEADPSERIKAAESLAKWGGVVKESPENNIVIQIKGGETLLAQREQVYRNPECQTAGAFTPVTIEVPEPLPDTLVSDTVVP